MMFAQATQPSLYKKNSTLSESFPTRFSKFEIWRAFEGPLAINTEHDCLACLSLRQIQV